MQICAYVCVYVYARPCVDACDALYVCAGMEVWPDVQVAEECITRTPPSLPPTIPIAHRFAQGTCNQMYLLARFVISKREKPLSDMSAQLIQAPLSIEIHKVCRFFHSDKPQRGTYIATGNRKSRCKRGEDLPGDARAASERRG